MKFKALMGVLVAAMVLVPAGGSVAATNHASRISMHYQPAAGGQFAGKVRSRNVCTAGRRIVIYRKRPGRDASLGRARTTATGKWRLRTGKPRRGDYYARVLPRSVAGGVRCGGARSAVTHVS